MGFARRSILLVFAVLLAGCAASPDAPEHRQRSDAALAEQVAQARAALAPGQPPRVVFAGFALHSESKAFQGDVRSTERLVREIDPQAVVFRLSNPALGQDAGWPFATRENVQAVLGQIGAQARPADKVVLLFAGHGAPGKLQVWAGNRDHGRITDADLRAWLEPLRGKPTLVVLSACYSGAFIPALREPSRIILTAAAANRNSFGCDFHSANTVFIEELLRDDAPASRSLAELMASARARVAKREQTMKLIPSSPLMFVGREEQAWARQPLAQWLHGTAP